MTDCFLSHSWANGTHEIVQKVNRGLQLLGIVTWFDDDQMGHCLLNMESGIEETQCFVTFINANYVEKVAANGKNNCKREFVYADTRLNTDKMIAVIMEPDFSDHRNHCWKGKVASTFAAEIHLTFLDFSDDGIAKICTDIKDEIIKRCGSTIAPTDETVAVAELSDIVVDNRGFSMDGWFEQGGSKWDMNFSTFLLKRDGKEIYAVGEDDVSNFEIKGNYDRVNEVFGFIKQYVGPDYYHQIAYEGSFKWDGLQNLVMAGTWYQPDYPDNSGSFEIHSI